MKINKHHYGGWYIGFIRSKWLTIWFSDYRKNTVVKDTKFQLEIYSKLWGNKILKI